MQTVNLDLNAEWQIFFFCILGLGIMREVCCNLSCCLLCISCHIQSSDPWILIEASLGKGASITFESKWGTQSWRNAMPIRVGPKFKKVMNLCLFVWFRVQAKRTWIHVHKEACTVIPQSLGKGASITFESKWGTQSWRNAMPIRVGLQFKKKLGRYGRQSMLRPYLKIWEWIFSCTVKAISSLGIHSPCIKCFGVHT